jgi:peptidoglycan/LPS O-acetylase OafA/YrhL
MFYLVWAEGPTVLRLGTVSAMWLLGLVQSARELPRLESYFLAPLSAAVVCTTITVFFVILLLVSLRRTGLFGRRNWVFVGALTYPLYLIHNEIGYALLNGAYGHVNRYVLLVALSAGALGVAYGIHALFERRLARMLKSALKATLDYSGRQLFKQPARLASEETD